MEASPRHSPHQTAERWWELPSWEQVRLIAIKYRKLLLGFVLALLFLFTQGQLNTMDHRLFQLSVDGVRGLVHYETGGYSDSALAYRADE